MTAEHPVTSPGDDAPTDAPGTAAPLSPSAVHPLVVRTVAIDPLPGGPAALIDLLPDARPLAWVRRGDGIVGWGEALRLESWGPGRFADAEAAWHEVLEHAVVRDAVGLPGTGPVAFGSFAFDDAPVAPGGLDDDASGARPSGVVVVPRVVVGRHGGTTWLTTIDPSGSLATTPGAHLLPRPGPVAGPGRVTVTDGSVAAADWEDLVAEAARRIRAGELDKVVLARDVLATTERPVDPRYLLGRLATSYESCWTFSVDGMVGATPELLVRSEKGLVTSRVLAGTLRRADAGGAPGADPALFLAQSSKDLSEHEYAVRSVADALEPFCSSMNVPDAPFVLHLPNVLHLASDVTGVLRPATPGAPTPSSLALAAALHPSAAVCGTPTPAAQDLIHAIEGLDRGRYAAPVGWFGADGDGEWGIALRSCELSTTDPNSVRLFAGCGIVAASDPAAELAESAAKLEPVLGALGVRNDRGTVSGAS